jgi:peptidoglycan/xylan/chitin deacetylase (PgdA/CDA1 family)
VHQGGPLIGSTGTGLSSRTTPDRTVVLTFDDGRASDYDQVFPRLQESGWVGEFFVNPATIGRHGYLSWSQVRQMSRAGMRFQSHGYDHVDLSRLSAPRLQQQLQASKQAIEDATGRAVEFLAAPFGALTRRIVEAALCEGYGAVCTSTSWPARPGADTINRVAVRADTGSSSLGRLLDGDLWAYSSRMARSAAVYVPKRLLAHWPAWLGANPLDARR